MRELRQSKRSMAFAREVLDTITQAADDRGHAASCTSVQRNIASECVWDDPSKIGERVSTVTRYDKCVDDFAGSTLTLPPESVDFEIDNINNPHPPPPTTVESQPFASVYEVEDIRSRLDSVEALLERIPDSILKPAADGHANVRSRSDRAKREEKETIDDQEGTEPDGDGDNEGGEEAAVGALEELALGGRASKIIKGNHSQWKRVSRLMWRFEG